LAGVATLRIAVVMSSHVDSAGANRDLIRSFENRLKPVTSFQTDNPRLNEKIAKGEAQVYEYIEPSDRQKKAIDQKLRDLGYPESVIQETPWSMKEDWAKEELPYQPLPGTSQAEPTDALDRANTNPPPS
jgi:hypothetical protein